MTDRPFLSRVRKILPDLHPAERKLGELVCNFPGELASYSASELADLAEVSNATVSRFIRRLGYKSYEEARRHARLEKDSGSRLYLGTVKVPAPHAPQAYAETDMRNIQRTIEAIDEADIDRLAEALLSARKVWVIGFRVGAPLAHYLQWQLLQVVESIVALPGAGQTMGENLAGLHPDDVVVLFGLRRRVTLMEPVLAAIEGSGAQLAFITDESMPTHAPATWHFRCATESSGPLFSHVGVMALLNLVANRTIDTAGEAGRARLAAIEALNDRLGEL
ncbi:MurR/RpiR family transcriptional regulator [Pararhodobacter zhoushanensis]|uniref:MurR/RpiR family transcriptional regulator n=1 Tax=Pararhodobacter zhoushanensis TaxID=2479545 RepID=A0ABT3H4A8_9RHOB|nr:MurR/RpiR family transcriptional regulator [Pararhodobacter zhoushanensis]MCW1934578.1 MurR/RpiR family transcriptional regulator [Pararhodobacter zhoushanensis]